MDCRTALLTVLDQVDYTNGACHLNEMVGAVLSKEVIVLARKATAEADEKNAEGVSIATLEARIKELEAALELGLYMLTIPAVGDVKKAIDYDPNMGPSKNVIADFEKKANSALKVTK